MPVSDMKLWQQVKDGSMTEQDALAKLQELPGAETSQTFKRITKRKEATR